VNSGSSYQSQQCFNCFECTTPVIKKQGSKSTIILPTYFFVKPFSFPLFQACCVCEDMQFRTGCLPATLVYGGSDSFIPHGRKNRPTAFAQGRSRTYSTLGRFGTRSKVVRELTAPFGRFGTRSKVVRELTAPFGRFGTRSKVVRELTAPFGRLATRSKVVHELAAPFGRLGTRSKVVRELTAHSDGSVHVLRSFAN
jgi:hypothetical protein